MKKLFFVLAFTAGIATMSIAQTAPKQKVETKDDKSKTKPKTTVGDKAHNLVHPHHKTSHGVKSKEKHGDAKTKVETKPTNS
jgi:hypothetical protein